MDNLQFDSLAELFCMSSHGGCHGPYVWSAYAIFLLGVGYLVCMPLARRKRLFKQMRAAARRQERAAAAKSRDTRFDSHS